ncbi:MAG TPA: ABC-2 family transporter protein [Armatimonadota bacterium]|nr:ABC-2 family transporter protein [Armatimonadota bacterium]
MRRYLRLYGVFLDTCFAREAEFRANFWANLITNSGWLLFSVALIKVVYLNTPSIAGWSEAEAMVLTGTHGLVQGLFSIVAFQNLSRLPEQVRLGTLDYVVTKPVSPLFMVSTRYVKLDSLGNALGAAAVILYGVSMAGRVPAPPDLAAYTYLTVCALAIYYGVYLLLMTLSFWFVRVDNLAVLSDVIFHIGRYPVDIFHRWVWSLFVYIVPLAFVACFPARALFGRLGPGFLALGAVFAVLLGAAAVGFWRLGLRSYSSASS